VAIGHFHTVAIGRQSVSLSLAYGDQSTLRNDMKERRRDCLMASCASANRKSKSAHLASHSISSDLPYM
jgi:hypothetical protein